jgi:hypothetical protein
MNIISALDIARYRKLADDIDAALGRGDEMGMEILRSILPDITLAIEGINEALLETDSLLYEGLRDEAIGLHDEEFPAVALRLHLQDKPQWPMAALYFETEGLTPPPSLDFGALSSLNLAFSELRGMRKSLDRWRRMALERAPLGDRIVQLRKLKSNDPTKPVWADQISAFEEVRILEVADAVKRAIQERNADRVAALHQELTRDGWGVPVPRRLIDDTRGGEAWASLRRQFKTLGPLVQEIERVHALIQGGSEDSEEEVDTLRSLTQQWEQSESRCREWLFALPQCPAVSNACHTEAFGPRLDELRQKIASAMAFVGQCDMSDARSSRLGAALKELDYYVEHHPGTEEESQWLTNVTRALGVVRELSPFGEQERSAETLLARADLVVEDVRGRAGRRARARVYIYLAGVAAVGVVVLSLLWWSHWQRIYRQEIEWGQSLVTEARQGGHVAKPARFEALQKAYPSDSTVQELVATFDKELTAEGQRRATFTACVDGHKAALDRAGAAVKKRSTPPAKRLDEWPVEIFEAKAAFIRARLSGGLPDARHAADDRKPTTGTGSSSLPAEARKQFENEEATLSDLAARQAGLERTLANEAIEEFQRQVSAIIAEIPAASNDNAAETARELRAKLSALAALGKKEQSSTHQPVARVPVTIREQTNAIDRRLEKLID